MPKIFLITLLGLITACTGRQSSTSEQHSETTVADSSSTHTFTSDRQFLQQHHKDLVELQLGQARALVCPAYQGRVMTTTADGNASYGWLNYELIHSGKLLPHMNAFGGEDRFWLGPEGGQFALYFKKGDPFDGEHWQTPAAIDSEPFSLTNKTQTSATFTRNMSLINYSGTHLDVSVERTVSLLPTTELSRMLGINADSLKIVGVQSDNVIMNKGKQAWTEQTGMPSIWILGMMNASEQANIIIPYKPGRGQPVNDSYFGKVPAERLKVGEKVALFKADAKYRSKIGVSPSRVTSWVGSYDPTSKTLTLVTYDYDPKNQRYVNSTWEFQKDPFSGDVVNAYNDGPMKPGQSQMGNFYELESSSPAAQLMPGASMRHRHTTIHIQGPQERLSKIAQQVLSIDLSTVTR
jgi:hypothetical protein